MGEEASVSTVRLGPKQLTIPSGWKELTLGEINDAEQPICYGVLKPGPNHEEGIPLVKIEDIEDGFLQSDQDFHLISEGLSEDFSRSVLKGGEVLVSIQGTVGRVAVVPPGLAGANISRTVGRLTPSEVNALWLKYCLESKDLQDYMKIVSSGSTRSSYNIGDIRTTTVPVPPSEEQRKIASVLYTVDELIQKTEGAEDQNRELKKGLIQELFTEGYYDHDLETVRLGPKKTEKPKSWSVATLGDLAEYQNGYGFSKEQWADSGRPIIRIQDLTGSAGAETNYFQGEVDERYEVHSGDFLVSWSATLGVFRWTGPEAVLNQHIFKVKEISSDVDPDFLYYLLKKSLSLLRRKIHGTTMQHITRSAFENTPVVLPDLEEQKQIGNLLRGVDEKANAEAEYAEELRRLKKGLMQDLLTGEVRTEDVDIKIPEEVAAYG